MPDTSLTQCIVSGDPERLAAVRTQLRRVSDPEVGINIVDLGLVYGIEATSRSLQVVMTLTSPGCPVAEQLTAEVRHLLRALGGPGCEVAVHLVWDPPWSPERMAEAARHALGWT
jgi:metal-sulfur cluster biosynthetic enzyme